MEETKGETSRRINYKSLLFTIGLGVTLILPSFSKDNRINFFSIYENFSMLFFLLLLMGFFFSFSKISSNAGKIFELNIGLLFLVHLTFSLAILFLRSEAGFGLLIFYPVIGILVTSSMVSFFVALAKK